MKKCFWHSGSGLCSSDGAITPRSILGATVKKGEPHPSPCDFLPHPKSALWDHPTSGLLVSLSHPPSPVPIAFTPSHCSLCPSGLPILKAGIGLSPSELRATPPSETRPYFGAPFLPVPAHQHRGVILEQRVRGGNHGGGGSSSPAAALQLGPCLPSPWKPPLRPHGLGGASGRGGASSARVSA